MSELLEPTGETDETPTLRYPWGEWMDGKPRRLAHGEDFYSDPRTIRTYIYAMARKRGLRVAIAIEPTDHIVLQAYDPTTQRRPLLPSPYRRLANGMLDRTAPDAARPSTPANHPECSVCGKPLTPAARPFGMCAKFNPASGRIEVLHT